MGLAEGQDVEITVRVIEPKSTRKQGEGFLRTEGALADDPQLEGFGGRVSDSGEGRWTLLAAIDEGVPVPVLTTALYERFTSRGDAEFQDKLLSAMRFGFGGHLEKLAK